MSNRFGFNAPGKKPLESYIQWAGVNNFRYIDFNADRPPNALASFDEKRATKIRHLCDNHRVQIGLHPTSAINNAEDVPIARRGVDEYLSANLDLAQRLGAGWLIAHGGYHFGDLERRLPAVLSRLQWLVERAEQKHTDIFLENHNKEPDRSEIHYFPHNVEEMSRFFEVLDSPNLRWAFNAPHGHLVPEGWSGFLDAFGAERIGQVRLNDNNGDYEVHLVPGEGNMDFPALFGRLKEKNYRGWFSLGFGDETDKIRVRDRFENLL